ncbi:MAG: TetR family transcriptional regulator [Bordetella sp. SCN 67-23]|nr:TetR family transcriptional regulator [Burkholderiales bacterium]ODS76076.1 MAG: TetR family transcriptional regulator [Bordetella sp. SCN 67-23]OJW92207.1 MAG: TetR family transcriptional regulator [Burkholderiales bacterium 67-32]
MDDSTTPASRTRATRESILRAATRVFARYGYDGGSLDKISRAAKSVDRMIYYYFGSKEGLFIAVLEDMYRRMGEAEMRLELDPRDPVASLETVIRFVFRYYRRHPEFIVLLNTENMHRGRHLPKSPRARAPGEHFPSPTMGAVARLLETGREQGLFRRGPAARDVYLMILATGYFYVSNRYTLSRFLGEDMDTEEAQGEWEDFVVETVLRTVSTTKRLEH